MFWDFFCRLCRERGVSPTQAVLDMGISRASVTKWKSGVIPRFGTIKKLSDYFGVPVAYFEDGTNNDERIVERANDSVQTVYGASPLTPDEQRLLALFAKLSEVERLRLILELQDKLGGIQ